MFNAPRERSATHNPGLNSQGLTFELAEQDGNLSQRPVFVLIANGHYKSCGIVQINFPSRFSQSLAVQVKLVGFINQLESPVIAGIFSESESDGSVGALKEIIQRAPRNVPRVAQSTGPANTLQPNRILFGNDIFPKEIPQTLQQIPNRLVIILGEDDAFHLGECGFYLRNFHGAVVNEN